MEMRKVVSLFFFAPLFVVSLDSGSVGINFGRIADNLPSPQQVVELLKSQGGITKIKIFDTESSVLSAFAGSGISLTVALPNEHLAAAAASTSFTDNWVQTNIMPYKPNTLIDAVAVGNEVFVATGNVTSSLVPAMENVYSSLVKYGVASSIKVSSPIALSSLHSSYPPSSGSFKADLIEPVVKPMLKFLQRTGSYLMVNVYPFFAYMANTDTISLDYALLSSSSASNTDPNNGLVYRSLFDAQLDAVYAATAAVGFNDVNIVVSETGWPSQGDANEVGASVNNAAAYNGNLVQRVLTGRGTPLRPTVPLNVYLFALFNENQKPGPISERNYGLFYPNQQKVYDIPLTATDLKLNQSKVQVPAPAPAPAPAPSPAKVPGQTWCVANENAGKEKLQQGLNFACGEGGVNCRPIEKGATCFDPNTLEAHASYAFNGYFQMMRRASGSCFFGGAAHVVTQLPNYQKFPITGEEAGCGGDK